MSSNTTCILVHFIHCSSQCINKLNVKSVSIRTIEVRKGRRVKEGGKEEKEAGMGGRKETTQLQLRNKHTQKTYQLLNGTRIKYAKKEVAGKTLKCF